MTQADGHRKTRGKLNTISGPSGIGNSTITREVINRLEEACLSVSMTTRPQAPGEQNGREYRFVSADEFRRRIEEGSFLKYAEVFGNVYGTPRDKTDEALRAGRTVILEIAAAWQYDDSMVINDDLEQAVNEVIQIVGHAQTIDEDTYTDQGNIGEE